MNILLTGGRAPVTLDLARAFYRAGHVVFMAESLRGHLSQPSRMIARNFIVPAPRQHTAEFIGALKKIVVENQIDLLIPTCEEVFYVAMGKHHLPCRVFVEPIEKMNSLHNKWEFALNAFEHRMHIPQTMLVKSADDVLHAYASWKELVLKPVYSRFASRTLIKPALKTALAVLDDDINTQWVAQEFIRGRQICTYSICHQGKVTAHAAYASVFTAGQGATIHFAPLNAPKVFQWVQKFVAANQFTGQIAFDFIETADGEIFALECNPRATSGAHLLASHPQFAEAFLNPEMKTIAPLTSRAYMLASAMLVYGFNWSRLGAWLQAFFSARDVIFRWNDPAPFLFQYRSILAYLKIAREQKITPLESSTFDIEWNGED